MDNLIYLPDMSTESVAVKNVKLQWKVSNFSNVKKGEAIMSVELSTGRSYSIKSPWSGLIVRIVCENSTIENPSSYKGEMLDIDNAHKVVVACIFDSYEDYIEKAFKNIPLIAVDDFTKNTTIKWKNVSKAVLSTFYSNKYEFFKDIVLDESGKYFYGLSSFGGSYMPLSGLSLSSFGFSFMYEHNVSIIEFTFNSKKIKIQKNDTVSFLFDNGEIVDYKVPMRPYKIDEAKDVRYFKCPLYEEDVHLFSKQTIIKWRVAFEESGKPAIEKEITSEPQLSHLCGVLVPLVPVPQEGKNRPYLIKKYAKDYLAVLYKVCPSYEHPKRIVNREREKGYAESFEWCYVYLMKDMRNGYYKIGISNNPDYREHTLQSEKPTIELLSSKRYPSRKIAEAFEKALHQAFRDQHIRGEWFSLSDYNVAMILETLK